MAGKLMAKNDLGDVAKDQDGTCFRVNWAVDVLVSCSRGVIAGYWEPIHVYEQQP